MSDHMMDMANTYLDGIDAAEDAFERAEKRWIFDEAELMRLSDDVFENPHDAYLAILKVKAYQQWQKPNGEWEWVV